MSGKAPAAGAFLVRAKDYDLFFSGIVCRLAFGIWGQVGCMRLWLSSYPWQGLLASQRTLMDATHLTHGIKNVHSFLQAQGAVTPASLLLSAEASRRIELEFQISRCSIYDSEAVEIVNLIKNGPWSSDNKDLRTPCHPTGPIYIYIYITIEGIF